MTYASVAANPGPVSYDYAVGSLQAPSSKAYNSFQALGDGVAAATQAGTSFGQANVVNYAYPDDYHTSKIGNFGTDIVCNDAGQCAEAYTTAFWDSCPNVYFDYMHLYKEDDTGAVGEYGIFLKRSGQDRRRIWGWTDMGNGDDRNINQTHEMCQGDYFQVEEHDTTSGNEKMGTHTPNLSGPHFGASHRFNADPADDGEVYYDVTPDNTFYIGAMRLLNSDLGPAAGSNYAHYYVGAARNPAVATSGSRWLTGSEMAGGNQANQIIGFSVNNSNGDFRTVRFDDSDTRDDHDLDIVWAGSRFLAVWERDYSATDHDIEMAVLNGTGVVTERKHVDFTSSSQRLPSIAYNPDQNQALVVYLSGDEVVGRFIEGTTVGNRFSIAPKPFGDNFWFGPKVAYEAGTKTWVVSYTSENSVTHVRRNRYLALSQGTLGVPPIPLTAPKLHPANRLHDLACNNDPNQDPNFVIRSSCAIVESTEQSSGTPLELNTIILESTPPWIGGGGGFSNTETKVLIVDRDVPTSTITSFSPGATVVVTDTFVFGGEAGDPTSEIAFVDVNIPGVGWQRATGLNSWSIAWDTPLADGSYTIQTRATDVVGN